MEWIGFHQNNDELHETFFDALAPTFIYHFANNLGDKLVLSFIVGSILVVLSPWGELVPVLLAWLIATFTTYMIWNPTMLLTEFSVPLALLYLTTVWPVFAIVIIYAIRKVRGSEEETNERAAQL